MQVWLGFVLLLGLFSFLASSIRFLTPAFANIGAHTSVVVLAISFFIYMNWSYLSREYNLILYWIKSLFWFSFLLLNLFRLSRVCTCCSSTSLSQHVQSLWLLNISLLYNRKFDWGQVLLGLDAASVGIRVSLLVCIIHVLSFEVNYIAEVMSVSVTVPEQGFCHFEMLYGSVM